MNKRCYISSDISLRDLDFQQVQDILNGEQELWNPLYTDSYKVVLYSAMQADKLKLLQMCDYYDIADEAFTLCYKHLDRYRGLSRFRYWVGGYARNITRNRCSRELTKRRNNILLENLAQSQMSLSDPLLILIRLERDACLWKAFFNLQSAQQKIINALLWQNISPRRCAVDLYLTRKEVLFMYDAALYTLRHSFTRYYCHHKEQVDEII